MKLFLAHLWLNKISKKHKYLDTTNWKPLSERYPNESVKELWGRVGK